MYLDVATYDFEQASTYQSFTSANQYLCHWCCPVCITSVHWLLILNKPLFQSFVSLLFANLMLICLMSATDVPLVLSCLYVFSAISDNFDQVIVSVVCSLGQFAKQNDFFNASSTYDVGAIFQYNTRALAGFEQFTVSLELFFVLY